jgi:hypothetical protein
MQDTRVLLSSYANIVRVFCRSLCPQVEFCILDGEACLLGPHLIAISAIQQQRLLLRWTKPTTMSMMLANFGDPLKQPRYALCNSAWGVAVLGFPESLMVS